MEELPLSPSFLVSLPPYLDHFTIYHEVTVLGLHKGDMDEG